MHGIEDLNLRKAIKYLQEEKKHKLILVECGPSTVVPMYSETHAVSKTPLKHEALDYKCDGNPVDTILLSMFMGTLVNPACLGKPFLNSNWL